VNPIRLALSLIPLLCACEGPPSVSVLDWPEPVAQNRPGLYWWIPGSAMDEEDLTWNLETLRDAGFGGVSMISIYGVKGEEERFLEFLSPRWVEMFDHAAREAERLGLWLDLTPGGGWRLGGPEIDEARGEQRIAVSDGGLQPESVGSKVKRAGPGATGRAINPYSKEILLEYLAKFEPVFEREGSLPPRAFYHDSFEYQGNWCDGFLEAFEDRRGYDLADHALALSGEGAPDTVARVRHDYRETLSDLHLESVEALVEWASRYGAEVRQQAHGSPTNLLDGYALCGIPETEIFGAGEFAIPGLRREADNVRRERPAPLVNRLASSAAHVAGRRLVASETCTWVRNHFRTALSQVKPEVDRLFLAGINHVFFHGCCYSPKDAEWPGWLFYASLQCNPRNAFWRDIGALTAYVTRCQSILQAGVPDQDLLVYWPIHDLWSETDDPLNRNLAVHHPEFLTEKSWGRTARALLDGGYSFDFVSDRLLCSVRFEEDRLTANGARWSAVIVPPTVHLPVGTLEALEGLATQGATVIFEGALPRDVPGLGSLESRRESLRGLLDALTPSAPASGSFAELRVGAGRILVGDDVGSMLDEAAVLPEEMVAAGLRCIRRRHGEATHYFIANEGPAVVDGWIGLARPASSAVLLDPMTGKSGVVPLRGDGAAPEVRLQLRPGESRILKLLLDSIVDGPAWRASCLAGEPRELVGEWRVEFTDGGPVLPASFTTLELASWTELGEEEAGRFAGTARYRLELELPEGVAHAWRLALGDVRESALIFIDGKRVGTLIAHPYTLDLLGVLRPGRHVLEIEVTNLSANRIRDLDRRGVNWKRFHDINFVDHEYRKFDASGWPLAPSGLLGPVTITALRFE